MQELDELQESNGKAEEAKPVGNGFKPTNETLKSFMDGLSDDSVVGG